jgi:hypothetical protein
MTEEEWLRCEHPGRMLNFLERAVRRRKVRLFACACCRRLWPSLASVLRKGLETSERHADGQASSEEMLAARLAGYASLTTASAAAVLAMNGAGAAARYAAMALAGVPLVEARRAAERKVQAGLLRDIFGPLLFREVRIDPLLLNKNDALIPQLARAAYEDRSLPAGALDGTRLQVLADALEDAGLTDSEVLEHLRSGEPHVRGCWAVDILLGQE